MFTRPGERLPRRIVERDRGSAGCLPDRRQPVEGLRGCTTCRCRAGIIYRALPPIHEPVEQLAQRVRACDLDALPYLRPLGGDLVQTGVDPARDSERQRERGDDGGVDGTPHAQRKQQRGGEPCGGHDEPEAIHLARPGDQGDDPGCRGGHQSPGRRAPLLVCRLHRRG